MERLGWGAFSDLSFGDGGVEPLIPFGRLVPLADSPAGSRFADELPPLRVAVRGARRAIVLAFPADSQADAVATSDPAD